MFRSSNVNLLIFNILSMFAVYINDFFIYNTVKYDSTVTRDDSYETLTSLNALRQRQAYIIFCYNCCCVLSKHILAGISGGRDTNKLLPMLIK